MARDNNLRSSRMVFYERDVERLEGELDSFLEVSNAKCAMLIDKEGHLVTRRGEPLNSSLESISALIAGSFAATKEMARLLGEDEFAILFHQGVRDSIQLQLIGERTLLAILFDERTNLGLVRFYAQESVKQIEDILTEISDRPEDGETGLSSEFSSEGAALLDNLF